MNKLLRLAAAVVIGTLLLAGCTAPRTAQDDAAVHAVGVVSLVDESGPVRRLGLTVFNNNQGGVEQGGKLRQVVDDTVRQRLQRSRPGWTVKAADAGMMAAIEAKRKPHVRLSTNDVASELADVTRKLGVDQLFVVEDTAGENFPGQGVGITFRAIGNDPGTVMVHSFVALAVLDRDGKVLVTRGATKNNPRMTPNTMLGLRSDLGTLNDPKVRANVAEALQAQLKAAVEEALDRAGY